MPEPADRIEALLAAAEREADAARRDIEARRAAMEAELRGYADAVRGGGADPGDRAARIERLAADALRSVGELAVTLTELAQALRSDAPAAEAPPAPAPGPLPASARLLAIEMAIAGHGREAVSAALEQRLGKPPPTALLDEVFGEDANLTWGRPAPPL